MDVSEGGRASGIWHRYLPEVPATSIFSAVKHNFCHAIPALTRTYVSDCTAIITVARFSNLTDYVAATSTREKPNYTANCPQSSLTVDACVSPVLLQQFPLFLVVRLFNLSLLLIFRAFFCENRLESNITARIVWRIKNIHGLGKGNLSPNITNSFQLWRNLCGPQIERSLRGANSCDAVGSNTGHRLPKTGNTQVGRKLLQIPVLLWRSVKITGIAVRQLLSLRLEKKCFGNFFSYRNPLLKFVTEFQ